MEVACGGLTVSVRQPAILTVLRGLLLPEDKGVRSTALTMLMPLRTLPKTTCLPSSQLVLTVVMKNWGQIQ